MFSHDIRETLHYKSVKLGQYKFNKSDLEILITSSFIIMTFFQICSSICCFHNPKINLLNVRLHILCNINIQCNLAGNSLIIHD